MSIDFNSTVLCGNLTADPQLENGFLRFTVAVREKESVFIPVKIHEKMCSKKTLDTLKKGVGVLVTGRINHNSYTDKNGKQAKYFSLQAQTVQTEIPGNINNVVLFGRLTSDPELRKTPSNQSVVSFNIANNYAYKKDDEWVDAPTSFFSVVAWNHTAEFVEKHFRKGSAILLTGKIVSRQWEDKNTNQKKTAFEIVANHVSFAQKNKSEEKVNETTTQHETPSYQFENAWDDAFTEIDDGEDLPF